MKDTSTKQKTTTLLIDGDIVAYRIAAGVETAQEWAEDRWTVTADLREAKQLFENQISKWLKDTGTKGTVLTFSERRTFRHDLSSGYKANRKGKAKPIIFSPLVRWAIEDHKGKTMRGLEADDIMGILSGPKSIIVSADKDLRTVPGLHLDLKTNEVITVTEDEANHTLFMQALTGDAVDGYAGLRGVGPKNAERILGDAVTEEELWEKVCEAYTTKGSTEEEALLSLRLARILRPGEYDQKTETPKLWSPA